MKKFYLFAAFASFALVSCMNDEFVGDNSPTDLTENADGAILFGFDMQNTTRADKVGSDAATTLQNQFIVYGTKHASAENGTAANDEAVFTNYVVEYTDNTAGTVASNTHNWDYVGKTAYAAAKVSPAIDGTQAIKYWDYSAANGYTFYGIASKADIATNNKVTVTKTTTGSTVYDKGYSVVLSPDANLDQLFVADRKPVAKGDFNKPVTLTFRNFGARVRVGFYETIPGYKVTINKFYAYDAATAAITAFTNMTNDKTTFTAALQNISTSPTSPATNTMTVSYYDNTDPSIENHVKLTASTVDYDYNLALGSGVVGSELSTSAASPTWDNSGNYTTVYPFEANSNPMLIKIDYTLTAEDITSGAETIEVKGANVVVPKQYVQWKSNFAYTYLFKISDNTNGTTDGTTQGLYPITFDAVVVNVADDKTQETITTFEDYSITTYANGSKVTTNNEYKAGEDIYVVKTNNSTGKVVEPTGIGIEANNVQIYVATASVGGDAISEATIKARLTGSPNGITLTATTSTEAAALVADGKVPAADGTKYDFGANGAVKFTPSPAAAATYVYVYTRTKYVKPTYTSVGSSAFTTTTYYFKNTVSEVDYYYPAEGINADNFDTYKASLYTQTDAGTPGVYDIKVIKVNP